MPSIAPHVRQRLLCRSDLEGMSVEGERIAAWLWSGQLEVVGSIAGENGDDAVYSVNTEALRSELGELLAAHGRTDLEFSGEAARQLLHEPAEQPVPGQPIAEAAVDAGQAAPENEADTTAEHRAVEDVLAEHVAEEQLDTAIDEITDAIGTLLGAHHRDPLELRDDAPQADREDTVSLETAAEDAADENLDASQLGDGEVLLEFDADDGAGQAASEEAVADEAPLQDEGVVDEIAANEIEATRHEEAEAETQLEGEATTGEADADADAVEEDEPTHAEDGVDEGQDEQAQQETSASVFDSDFASALDAALEAALPEHSSEVLDANEPETVASQTEPAVAPQQVEVHVQLDIAPLEAPLHEIQQALQQLAEGQPSPQTFAPIADSIADAIRSLQATVRENAERAQQDDRIDRIHATLEEMTDALGALRNAESQRARATERRLRRAERGAQGESFDDGRTAILVAGSVAIVGWVAAMWLHGQDLRLALGALVTANLVSLLVLARRRGD